MRRFELRDITELNRWREAHGLSQSPACDLPELGAFEPGVAACFLYVADGGLGIIEGLITNPDASPEDRHRAMADGWSMLHTEAKARGCRRLVCITTAFASTKRALETAGFCFVQHGLACYREI